MPSADSSFASPQKDPESKVKTTKVTESPEKVDGDAKPKKLMEGMNEEKEVTRSVEKVDSINSVSFILVLQL